jgi:hypothetical protein
MSEKKAHEVTEMSAFVASVASRLSSAYVVDVGAGQVARSTSQKPHSILTHEQGYLTKALASPPHCLNVLALESSSEQIEGSRIRTNKQKKTRGMPQVGETGDRIAYTELKVEEQSLVQGIGDWVARDAQDAPTPVVLLGLHACGALTPSVMRTAVECRRPAPGRSWYVAGMVIVGCCYHLMKEKGERAVVQPGLSLWYLYRFSHV